MSDDMQSIKKTVGDLMQKLADFNAAALEISDRLVAMEVRNEADPADPGPLPIDWDPGYDNVFDQQTTDLHKTADVLDRVSAVLAREDNIIRPSVALEIAAVIIDELILIEVEPFYGFEPVWRETERVLREAASRAQQMSSDAELGWQLEVCNADFADVVMPDLATLIRVFHGQWAAAMGNTVGSSFGRVTPGELMQSLYYMFSQVVPNGGSWRGAYHPIFTMQHPTVKNWIAPQPWAAAVREQLRVLAQSMSDITPVVVPAEPPPYSVGGRF